MLENLLQSARRAAAEVKDCQRLPFPAEQFGYQQGQQQQSRSIPQRTAGNFAG